MGLCEECAEADSRWLDAITPGPHRAYPWEAQPVGRFRIEDAGNLHARTSVGAQLIRRVREQRRVIRTICERDHQNTTSNVPAPVQGVLFDDDAA